MKKMKRNIFTGIIVMTMLMPLKGQLSNVAEILKGGVNDANKLVGVYLEPFGKGFAYDLSNGWYNTASTHGILGFDITFTANIASIPSSQKTYDLAGMGLSTLTLGTKTTGPTIAGKKDDGADLRLVQTVTLPDNSTQSVTTNFKMPKGANLPIVPTMMLQAGIGLPKGTEIMGRYLPTIKIGDYGKLGLWGVGIKHDLKQWIPVVNKTPFWSMSLLVAYTSFKTSVKGKFLTPDPDQFYLSGVDVNNDYNDQGVELKSSALNTSLLLSTNIPVINVYAGLGLVSASSKLNMTGVYPVPDTPKQVDIQNSIDNGEPIKMGVKNVKDPISASIASKTAFKATIGLRLKLALLTIHGDYSVIDGYNIYSAGLGISFR